MARILPSATTVMKHQVTRFHPVAPPAGKGSSYAAKGRPKAVMFIKRMPRRAKPRMVSSAWMRSSRRTGATTACLLYEGLTEDGIEMSGASKLAGVERAGVSGLDMIASGTHLWFRVYTLFGRQSLQKISRAQDL